jgi:predicted secreted protein
LNWNKHEDPRMTITAAIVTFATLWFLVLFCVLPYQFKSQAEAGEVVPGTPSSAPADAQIGRKAKITTAITAVLFVAVYGIVRSGWITVDNMDVFGILN